MDSRLILPVNTVIDNDYRLLRVVGSGGFGITYEAEDIKLGTLVAIKEYYPVDFGERDATMSVRPRSERHKQPFEKGRTNFLEEARTLARFNHPSIVQVTRVLEANSTAYMVMRFERGQSFEAWLKGLGRPPTQGELDTISAQLLDALQVMHDASFLHRDIAPDNIIVRDDGTPVLLDFGAARRAVAEMSRSLTGIVKVGYSPHEQYATGGRLQGPWTDLYAFGATLYRAVTGEPPEEATLRVTDDSLVPAATAAKGTHRRSFLTAIDACLIVHPSERPQSVAQLRPMLLGSKAGPKATVPLRERAPAEPATTTARRPTRRWPAIAATVAAVLGGAYVGLEYKRGTFHDAGGLVGAGRTPASDTGAQQAAIEAERRRRNDAAADARRRQAEGEAEEARRQKELAAAEEKRREESRIAALEETRRAEERRKEDERLRLAAIPGDDQRAELVRKVQLLLKRSRCWDGAISGRSTEAQDGLDTFVDAAKKRGKTKPVRIELAKASVGDFETWLKDADPIKDGLCAPKPTVEKKEKAPPRAREAQERTPQAPARSPSQSSNSDRPGRGGNCGGIMFFGASCHDSAGRRCTQTPTGRTCE